MTEAQLTRPEDEQYDRDMVENLAPSVGRMFRDRVAATPGGVAYSYPDANENWNDLTWAETDAIVTRYAAGLISLGITAEDRVAIASGTRYEWILMDLAIMLAGGATTTVYPTTIAEDVAYILDHSGSVIVVAENKEQVDKINSVRERFSGVRAIIVIDPTGVTLDDHTISLDRLAELGDGVLAGDPQAVDTRIDESRPEHLATIIYTSGTTGRPKGVRLKQSTWAYQGAASVSTGLVTADDVMYLWLPLAHVFGKQLICVAITAGMKTAVDGRIDKIIDNLAVVKPTTMAAAPRIFEKVYGKVSLGMEEAGGIKYKLFTWASNVGKQVAAVEATGRTPSGLLALQYGLADKLVLSKIRERFGGRISTFISGSAALNPDIAQWFKGAGMTILEGYGLTETSSVATVNRTYAYKLGSVGWPIPGTEIRIADDGEVLVRGPGVMEGYHNNPEATAEVIDAEGWFSTGDIGEIDGQGFLRITDRKKDLFKTSGGKYVAPSIIESRFKGICPYVGQFMVYGADRHFVTALVTLDAEAITPWAEANGLGGKSYEEIVSSPQARDMVQGYIDELNSGLNRWETIKKFHILGRDLTVEEGDLTPSLKLRRKTVVEKYADQLNSLYTT